MSKTFIFLVSMVLSLSTVRAYEFFDYRWPSATTTFNVDIPGENGLWDRGFREAMNRWNRATIFHFGIRYSYEDPCDVVDEVNGVGFASDICGEDSFDPETLALTVTWFNGTTEIESNIHFNNAYTWEVFDGPLSDDLFTLYRRFDFRRVAVHELGHALGLAHEEYALSIMHPTVGAEGNLYLPQADDIAGVAALFGDPTEGPPRPLNDDYLSAIQIENRAGRVSSNNVRASDEPGEPGRGSKSVWWEWTAPETGRLTVSTAGSDFDTTLGVYTGGHLGGYSSLRLLAENDDTDGLSLQSRVDLDVTADTTYWFRVAGYDGDSGDIVLSWVLQVSRIPRPDRTYIFPQFAFGGGWESTLMVQTLGSNTTCTFSAQDRFFTMRDSGGISFSGTQLPLAFGMNGWTIAKTATPQGMAASSGMAVLDCDEEVSAITLFSLEVGGSLVAEALVESSEEIVSGELAAQFLADHRDGARFAMAVANPSDQPLGVLIAVGDLDGQKIGEATVNVPANTAQAFFVDELVTIPTGHTGQVLIGASNNPGPSVYVVGLRVTGLVITTIPATIRR